MITQYHRPASIEEALTLLEQPAAIPLGGGTAVNAAPSAEPVTVVDLQGLRLDGVTVEGPTVTIGATTTLQGLVGAPGVHATLQDLARREAPSTIRNAATVGGTIGTRDPESELLAGLLAFDAGVTVVTRAGAVTRSLDDLLDDPTALDGAIVTAVSVPREVRAAADRTGRTPMDRPIVAAVACSGADGGLRVAVSGVGDRPILVDPSTVVDLDPPADFRGSSEYRRHLAVVLTARVVGAVGEDAAT